VRNCACYGLLRSYTAVFEKRLLLVHQNGRLQVTNRKVEGRFGFQPHSTNAIIKSTVQIGDEVLLDRLQHF
jgi:hypothetical protein